MALSVSDAWARPGMEGGNSAVYFRIRNGGDREDTLYAAESDVAEKVEIHETYKTEKGLMGMRHVPFVVIPAGGEILFKPGGYHVMLINLKRPLKEGDRITLVLRFKVAGEVVLKDVEVKVE